MGNRTAIPMQVRRLAPKDRERWLTLFNEYICFYDEHVDPAVVSLTFDRLVAGQELVGLVAVDASDSPLGLANLVFHPATWTATCHCYLEDLYVDPAARGRGVGRCLIMASYAEADRRGATRTYWFTAADNHEARRLYDRVGTLSPFVQYRR